MKIESITPKMSSREIAELTGKQHRNVLVDCDNLNISYKKMGLAEISAGVYLHPNTGSQQHREFLLTRMQTFDLMTGYNTELRIKVNRRWEELEIKESKIDFYNPDTVLQLAQNWAESERKLKEAKKDIAIQSQIIINKNLTIRQQQPKVLFADSVASSNKSILIAELAKILKQRGINIGQNRLFQWLRDNNYLCKKGEYYNQPTQKAMNLCLFELKKQTIDKPDGKILVTTTTKVTGKGQLYFINKFLAN